MSQLLTKKDLAERWQLSTQAIDNYIKDGILTPVKGIISIRFTEQHIAELEGIKLEKFSPVEKRRLEKELDEWKTRALAAESTLAQMNMLLTETLYLKQHKNT